MQKITDAKTMREADTYTIAQIKIPSLTLMERAAFCVAEEIMARFHNKAGADSLEVLILAGCGNNGGDGFAIGRILKEYGYSVTFLLCGDRARLSKECEAQLCVIENLGFKVNTDISADFSSFDIIVDAVFGIGLSREISGDLEKMFQRVNASDAYRVAVDIPSGISADTGQVLGCAFCADLTVTFAYAKFGHLFYPGADYTGELVISKIGIADTVLPDDSTHTAAYLLDDSVLSMVPIRKKGGNKGTYGRVLVVAGSENMYGACRFAAEAAYRTGAGLVQVFTQRENRNLLLSDLPEAILTLYDRDDVETAENLLKDALQKADAVVVGPGLSLDLCAKRLVQTTLAHASCPLVVDADGLTILADDIQLLHEAVNRIPIILTPHLGELSRLCALTVGEIKKKRLQVVRDFAVSHNVHLIAKDARTLIASPDGTMYVNTTGNDGMGTGGCGDVLAGVIAGLLAQKTAPDIAAYAGVYLHGMMGDRAAKLLGDRSLLAGDLLNEIADIMKLLG